MAGGLERLRRDPRVEHVDDERAVGNSIIVTLRNGWRYRDEGEHVFGEDTVKDLATTMRGVRPCGCEECTGRTSTGT